MALRLRTTRVPSSAIASIAAGALVSVAAAAQADEGTIAELEGVGVEQHLEASLPLEATFTNEGGRRTELAAAFDGLPVVLTLNYVDCPQQCSMQLAQLTTALAASDLTLGTDYRVVTVSIDPRDTPEKAASLRERYLTQYLVESGDAGVERPATLSAEARTGAVDWTVLVGDESNIQRVTETAGFGYRWLPDTEEYAHPGVTILCSPEGRITRYLPSIGPEMARELHLSIVEAGDGEVGSLWDRVFLNCFVYDPDRGSYSLAAVRLLKVAALVTVLSVVTGLFFMQRSSRASHAAAGVRADGGDTPS